MKISKLLIYFVNCAVILIVCLPSICCEKSFNELVLEKHNKLRKDHNTPGLELDDELNKACAEYAKVIADKDELIHSTGTGYGENLCYKDTAPEDCVQLWYDEIKDYNYKKPKFNVKTGHFTQLIWKASKLVGVGQATSYTPPGNVQGQFEANVLPGPGGRGAKARYLISLVLFCCGIATLFPTSFYL